MSKSTGYVLKARDYLGSAEPPATVLEDESREENDGAFEADGHPDWVQLPSGLWVLDFNAGNDRVIIPEDESLNPHKDFSLEAWINLDNLTLDYAVIDRGAVGAGNYISNYYWRAEGATGKQRLYVRLVGDTYESALSDTGQTATFWYHIIATWVNATKTIAFYLNGIPDGGGTLTLGIRQTGWLDFYIGTFNAVLNDFLGGMGKLRVRNWALSAGQVKQRFEEGRHWFGV